MTHSLGRIDNSNLWDKSYEALKKSIIKREFPPNQKLSIHDLSEQLGVSRTPIRDALHRLEMEGLVKTVSKVGTFVVGMTEEDIASVMDTRFMLELWVVQKLSSMRRAELAVFVGKMENILSQANRLIDSGDMNAYYETDLNLDFHLEFMRIGQNAKNIELYKNIMNYRMLAMRPQVITAEMIEIAQTQHGAIVGALREGSVEDIESAITAHLNDSGERLLNKVRSNNGVL